MGQPTEQEAGNDRRQRPSFPATTLASFMRLQHKQGWYTSSWQPVLLRVHFHLLSQGFPPCKKYHCPLCFSDGHNGWCPQDGELQHCCSNLSSISAAAEVGIVAGGTHALLPLRVVHLLPLLPILTVYAIKKPSKNQSDDPSLVSKCFQKHQVLNQGVWRTRCLFCKRSATNWHFLSSHAHL